MGQSVVVHSFKSDLAYSKDDDLFWRDIYQKAFPNMVSFSSLAEDMTEQKKGRDRLIQLSNGDCIYTDEKKRREVYKDFCLEYISDKEAGTAGWMDKDLSIDYIAYAFMPVRKVYLLPWGLLRRAWSHFKVEWIARYKRVEALNESGYVTVSVAVPVSEVYSCIKRASIIAI